MHGSVAIEVRAGVLLTQLRQLLDEATAGAVPVDQPELYVARIQGAITAIEAVLEVPPSLVL
jgi:hypothetical protein